MENGKSLNTDELQNVSGGLDPWADDSPTKGAIRRKPYDIKGTASLMRCLVSATDEESIFFCNQIIEDANMVEHSLSDIDFANIMLNVIINYAAHIVPNYPDCYPCFTKIKKLADEVKELLPQI